jgi:hypothetical protein
MVMVMACDIHPVAMERLICMTFFLRLCVSVALHMGVDHACIVDANRSMIIHNLLSLKYWNPFTSRIETLIDFESCKDNFRITKLINFYFIKIKTF